MKDAFICDAIRTPIGRYGGVLACVRPDDLGAPRRVRRVAPRAHLRRPAPREEARRMETSRVVQRLQLARRKRLLP